MDRTIVYPGAIPLDTDLLNPQRDAMIGLGWLLQATMGTATGVVGLACNPTTPASMVVNVGQGAIWAAEEIDPNAFGSLPADTSPLMKMGILPEGSGTNFTLTAPTTSGDSINYLIEATFQEADGSPVVLPYVNPANPSQPYSGPNNSGTAQNTVRTQIVELQLKAGAAAPTGSQTTPATDTGYVPLYVITVAYGQTTVTSSNIATASGAPFNGGPFAALNGSASEAFTANGFTTTNFFTSTGSAAFLQNANYSASVNAGNTGYIEHYVAPATDAQAAVNLSQAQANFAALNGNASEVFNASNGNSGNEVVNISQYVASFAAAGYIKLPNGIILQWQNQLIPTQVTTTINFPIVFPNAVFAVIPGLGAAISKTAFTSVGAQSLNTTGFSVTVGASAAGSDNVWFISVGY